MKIAASSKSMKTERIVPAMTIGESEAEPGGKFTRGTLAS